MDHRTVPLSLVERARQNTSTDQRPQAIVAARLSEPAGQVSPSSPSNLFGSAPAWPLQRRRVRNSSRRRVGGENPPAWHGEEVPCVLSPGSASPPTCGAAGEPYRLGTHVKAQAPVDMANTVRG